MERYSLHCFDFLVLFLSLDITSLQFPLTKWYSSLFCNFHYCYSYRVSNEIVPIIQNNNHFTYGNIYTTEQGVHVEVR